MRVNVSAGMDAVAGVASGSRLAYFLLTQARMSVLPRPRRILVIAADDNFSGTIGRILCRCGYTIDRVSSGEAAMQALGEHAYDLVLSEVALPGVCGLTVLCSARQHGWKTPFVLLGMPETERRRWIVSGLDDVHCLPLPLDVDRLKEVVAGCLDA
jgi:DNA-binding response OmpR family regulator